MKVILIKFYPKYNDLVENIGVAIDKTQANEYIEILKTKWPDLYNSGYFELEEFDLIDNSDNEHYTISIPNWCKIGRTVLWNEPEITGYEWVKEKIISFGNGGFFHQAYNCPVYFTKFSEFGKTIKLEEN